MLRVLATVGTCLVAALVVPGLVSVAYLNLGSVALAKIASAGACSPFAVQSCTTNRTTTADAMLRQAGFWNVANRSASVGLAKLDLVADQPDRALVDLTSTGDSKAMTTMAALAQAAALWRVGRQADALLEWRRLRAGPLLDVQAAQVLAHGHAADAARIYQLAIQVDDRDLMAHLGLAEAERTLGQSDASIASYERAFGLGAHSPEAARQLSQLLAQDRRYDDAKTWLNQALEWHPNYLPYMLDLGDVNLAAGDLGRAGQIYEQAVQSAPQNGWAHTKLGFFLGMNGYPDEGLAELRRGVELAPDSRDGWLNLARFYWERNRDGHAAIGAFRRGLELDPSNEWAHFALAEVYVAQGQVEEARIELAAALRVRPDYPEALAALDRLSPEEKSGP